MKNPGTKKILVAQLVTDGLQIRTALNLDQVAEYAERMKEGDEFPPVDVFGPINRENGVGYYLADGFHRVEALKRNGRREVRATVHDGGLREARRFAIGANAGLPRTNEDKWNALRTAWEFRREQFGENDPTTGLLARVCRVSSRLAERFFAEVAKSAPCGVLTAQRVGETGRIITVPTKHRAPVKTSAKSVPCGLSTPVETSPDTSTNAVVERAATSVGPVATVERKAMPNVMRDVHGIPIPKRLESVFDTSWIQEVANLVSRAKCAIENARTANDIHASHINQRALVHLKNAYAEIKAGFPFCVCPVCKGEGCRACSDAGYQNEDQYNRTPRDMR